MIPAFRGRRLVGVLPTTVPHVRQIGALLLTGLLLLSLVPGIAASDSGVGGSTVVAEDETVSSITGVYGTIIIEGTVTGDVSGVAGDIVVREGGVIEGNLDAAAGSIQISGTVAGSVSAGAGSITLAETGVVHGTFDAGAGAVQLAGQIGDDATIGADRITLGESANIAGSLTYNGELSGNTDAVAGELTRDRSLGPGMIDELQPFATWVFVINAFLLHLLLGVLLLTLFPHFSDRVARRVTTQPVRAGLIGVGTVIAIPLLLVLIAISIVGIPLSIAGVLFLLLIGWVGLVYGRFAVGYWLVRQAGVRNKWAGLLVGLLLGVGLAQTPFVGGVLNLIIILLGIGALVSALLSRQRRFAPDSDPASGTETTSPEAETSSRDGSPTD